MRKKKILIVVIMLIVILATVAGIFGYLYMTTDLLKSNKDLFAKYFNQNFEMVEIMKSSDTYNTYEKLKNEGTYESNTEIKIKHSEGGEISNPINNLSFKVDTKKDIINEYLYTDAQILFNEEEYLEAELIRDKDISGIRFSDVVRQFVTVRDDENIEKVSESLGIETTQLQSYINILNGTEVLTEQILTIEQAESLKQKYINIIKDNLNNAIYSKQKKSVITVRNNTIETNAYTLTLTQDDVGNIVMQILNNIKADEIILEKLKKIGIENFAEEIDKIIEELSDYEEIYELKITVYESKGLLLRTNIEYGTDKIVLENYNEDSKPTMNIQKSKINSEQVQTYNIEIAKSNNENQEVYNVVINTTTSEEQNTITLSSKTQLSNDKVTTTIELKYIEGIKNSSLIISNTVSILNELQDKLQLDGSNNVTLNDLDDEKRKYTIDLLKEKVPEKVTVRIGLLLEVLGFKTTEEPEQPNEAEMTQVEINRFNAKFEFYTGDSVSAENVKTLLENVKTNIGSAEITTIASEENSSDMNKEDLPVNIKITIEKDNENSELMNQILSKIEDKKKYKISISYKEGSGIIDYINISENKDR